MLADSVTRKTRPILIGIMISTAATIEITQKPGSKSAIKVDHFYEFIFFLKITNFY